MNNVKAIPSSAVNSFNFVDFDSSVHVAHRSPTHSHAHKRDVSCHYYGRLGHVMHAWKLMIEDDQNCGRMHAKNSSDKNHAT